MPSRPKYHVVRFNTKKNADLLPWLRVQKSEPTSIAQLIRLAQSIAGNRDWLKVAPEAERRIFTNNINSSNVKNYITPSSTNNSYRNNNSDKVSRAPHYRNTSSSSNITGLSKSLKKNGFAGF